jgi:predicted RND superfamily exporter protein
MEVDAPMDIQSISQHVPHLGIGGAFYAKAAAHLIRRRWWWLVGVILATAFFVMQIPNLRFDNSRDIWFVEGHETLLARDRFHDAFGNDDFVFLLFTKERTPFSPANLAAMAQLADQFENQVPYAREVTWLGNVERIRGAGKKSQEVLIEPFMAELPASQAAVDGLLQEALKEPAFVDDLISRDATVLTMVIDLDPYPSDNEDVNPRYTVAEAVNRILSEPRYEGLKPYLGGSPHFGYEYDALAKRDTSKLFMAVLAVQAALLLWLGRGLRGVVVPLLITTTSVLWTLGSISLLGFTSNLLTIALPTMLICVGIGDSLHGIAAFYDHVDRGSPRKEALCLAFSEVGGAIMLTSLTTAAGFLAYLTTNLKPYREMGVYIALGVAFAFVLTVILTPILYSFGKKTPKGRTKRAGIKARGDVFDRWLALIHKIVMTRTKAVVVIFTVAMAVTFAGYLMIEVESNTAELIFKREPLRQTLDVIDERLGTGMTLEYLIDTKKPSGIKDPVFMSNLDKLMTLAEKYPLVTKSVSITDLLKRMRRSLHGNDSEYYSLPPSRDSVAQHLFLYESSGGATLDRLAGFTYDLARLSLKMKYLDTSNARQLEAEMKQKAKELFGDKNVEIVQSGGMSLYLAMNDILYQGQSRSFIAALLAITLVMVMVLRSVKLGLISMIPNVFPVFLTMGFMGLAGIYLDVITVSFAAVVIGVAVDDTIHFFTRFRSEFSRWGNYDIALRETLGSVGRPITFTTLVLIVGNAVFMLSSLLAFFKLGILFGFAFLWALLADVFFAPALIVLLKPLGPERPQASNT